MHCSVLSQLARRTYDVCNRAMWSSEYPLTNWNPPQSLGERLTPAEQWC